MLHKEEFVQCLVVTRFACIPRGPGAVCTMVTRDNGYMLFRAFMRREVASTIRPVPARTTNIFRVRRGTTFHRLRCLCMRDRFLMPFEHVSVLSNKIARLARVRDAGNCSGGAHCDFPLVGLTSK